MTENVKLNQLGLISLHATVLELGSMDTTASWTIVSFAPETGNFERF